MRYGRKPKPESECSDCPARQLELSETNKIAWSLYSLLASQIKHLPQNKDDIPQLDFNSINFIFDVYDVKENRQDILEQILLIHRINYDRQCGFEILEKLESELKEIDKEIENG